MKEKILVVSIGLLVILAIAITVGTNANINSNSQLQKPLLENSVTQNTFPIKQPPQNSEIRLLGETIEIKQVGETKVFASVPSAKNQAELLSYKQRTLERLNSLNPGEQSNATITFNKPLDGNTIDREIASLLSLKTVNFISEPEGTGNADYPLTEEEQQRLSQLEQTVIQNMQSSCSNIKNELEKLPESEREIARQSFEKQCEGYKNFKLVNGFVSATARGTKEQLLELANNPNVFIVDVGPIELLKENLNAKIAVVKDAWDEYITYYRQN